uniref:Uncharacterized protein LOC108052458 n=1 Tax=Drosophila rhopaloa TaxID=1041015 RepID=A0A6P4FLL6_DRORH
LCFLVCSSHPLLFYTGDCQPVGLIDVTDCYYGFPISLSFPHFMSGDLGLQQNVTGINPDPANHSSAFVIQPESGLPLSLSVKVQINMHFKDLSNFATVSMFSHLTAPMLWFEIMMSKLPDSLDSRFNFYLNILPLVNPLGFWSGLLLGISLLGYAITRATLHMSGYARQVANISDGKYARSNLIQNHGGGSSGPAFSRCSIKLIDDRPFAKQHVIDRAVDEESAFRQLRRNSTYALDNEPALLDPGENSDDGHTSDIITLSSKMSNSCVEVEHFHDDVCFDRPLDADLRKESANQQLIFTSEERSHVKNEIQKNENSSGLIPYTHSEGSKGRTKENEKGSS